MISQLGELRAWVRCNSANKILEEADSGNQLEGQSLKAQEINYHTSVRR